MESIYVSAEIWWGFIEVRDSSSTFSPKLWSRIGTVSKMFDEQIRLVQL